MIQRRSQLIIVWFFVCDILATSIAWLAAYQVRFETGWIPLVSNPNENDTLFSHIPWVLFTAAVAYHFTDQYKINRMRRMREEAFCSIKGTFFLVLLLLAVDFFRKDLLAHEPWFLSLAPSMSSPFFLSGKSIGN